MVTEFGFLTDNVTDISPVRALVGLKGLSCSGSSIRARGKHCPTCRRFQGMQLYDLELRLTQVSDLSPLKGMPLTNLHCPRHHRCPTCRRCRNEG